MKEITCETCGKLMPIGEGDHLCDEDPTMLVLSNYTATDDYFWCGGRCWEEK